MSAEDIVARAIETMNSRKVTIDHNSIVALDKESAGAPLTAKDAEIALAMKGVLELAQKGQVEIILPAIAASERQPKGTRIGNFSDFKAKLAKLGIVPKEYSLPEMRLGVSFLGYATLGFSGPEWAVVQREIQQIIHPTMDWHDTTHKNWRNRYCDVSTMLAHLMANADLFISDDNVFLSQQKKDALLRLGANRIETARDGYELLLNQAVPKAPALDLPRFDDSAEKKCTYIPPNSYEFYRALRKEKGWTEL